MEELKRTSAVSWGLMVWDYDEVSVRRSNIRFNNTAPARTFIMTTSISSQKDPEEINMEDAETRGRPPRLEGEEGGCVWLFMH